MIDVKKIAKLARLGITEKETKKFQKEFSAILDFVEKLNEAETKGVEPMASVAGLVSVWRTDEENSLCQDKNVKENILKNAPGKEKGYFKVRRVLE